MILEQIQQLTQADMSAVSNLIRSQLASNVPLVQDLAEHLIDSGGKRLRPLMAILSAKCFNYQGVAHISLAAIIEFIHTATLLHDDVVDRSTLRRGKPTANALWGNSASVLVGDFLYSRAFQMMSSLCDMRVMDLLSNATNCIAEGEVMQLVNCGDTELTQDEYFEVITQKTAKLFEAASCLGATIACRSEIEIEAMRQYGSLVGIAFQLVDDALDYSSNAETMGKNIGDDLGEGKVTLPLIYVLQTGTDDEKALINEAIKAKDHSPYLDAIQDAIISTGAVEYTVCIAREYAERAIQVLTEHVPESSYRDALVNLAKFAVVRVQ